VGSLCTGTGTVELFLGYSTVEECTVLVLLRRVVVGGWYHTLFTGPALRLQRGPVLDQGVESW